MYKIIFNNNSIRPVYYIIEINTGKLYLECYSKARAEKQLKELNAYSFV